MTRPNVQNLYPNVYLDIVKTLNLSDRITEYENELNKKIDRFLAADLSTVRERKETERIFESLYSAIMSAMIRGARRAVSTVFSNSPPARAPGIVAATMYRAMRAFGSEVRPRTN